MRRRRVTYRPSRVQGLIGAVASAAFLILGIVWAIPRFGMFGIFWTIIVTAMLVYCAYFAFGGKYIGPRISIEDENEEASPRGDAQERLAELRRLYDSQLISDEEYARKREEILREL